MTLDTLYTKTTALVQEGLSAKAACAKTGFKYSTYMARKNRTNTKAKRTTKAAKKVVTTTPWNTKYPITLSGRTEHATFTITTSINTLIEAVRSL